MWDGGKFKQIEQGEYVFSVRQFAPFHAIKVLGELQKIIVPALGGLVGGAAKNPDADTNSFTSIAPVLSDALEKLAYTLDGDKLEKAVKMLLDAEYVAVKAKDGKDFVRLDEGAINEVFQGRVIDMIALAVEVFKVNYLDFSKLYSVPTGIRAALSEMKIPSFPAK